MTRNQKEFLKQLDELFNMPDENEEVMIATLFQLNRLKETQNAINKILQLENKKMNSTNQINETE